MHPTFSRRLAAAAGCAAVTLPLLALSGPAGATTPTPVVEGLSGPVAVETAPVPASEQHVDVSGVDRESLAALRADEGASAAPELLTPPTPVDDFDLVGVTWPDDEAGRGVQVQVRVREAAGWSSWQVLPIEDGGPTPGTEEYERSTKVVGTEPLLTDGADAVQVRMDTPTGRAPEGVEVALVDGGEGVAAATPSSSRLAATATSVASGLRPAIITRAQWGADESLARATSQNKTVTAMTIHHTASSNSYTTAEGAKAQLRSIYAYHTKTHGWSDIGYNFVVDKFGNVYEGRRGSITSMPVGAHASGFNTSTMGVSALGNYEEARPSSALVKGVASVVAWKLGERGLDPSTSTTLTSGGGTAKYARGTTVTLPRVFRHLDVGYTSCPGVYLSGQMGTIRDTAASMIKAAGAVPTPTVPTPTVPTPTVPTPTVPTPTVPTPATPPPSSVPAPVVTTGVPLVGDWDGVGGDQLGWFRDGLVTLRTGPTSTVSYYFGRAGDVPVVGDFDGDGKDSVGVFRDGQWYLRNARSSGSPDLSFRYGGKGQQPVVGRWGGKREGVGVVVGRRWLLRGSLTGGAYEKEIAFGRPGDQALVGDWDGDGKDTPGVRRDRMRYLIDSQDPRGPVTSVSFGSPTDRSTTGDLDGDGADTPGIERGGLFAWRDDLRGGAATASIRFVP